MRFTAITLSHSSSGMSTSANELSIPALFTSRSTGAPSSARARSNIATTCSSFDTSAAIASARPPAASISLTALSAGSAAPM